MSELRFEKPTPGMEKEAAAFADAFYGAGERTINGSAGLDYYDSYAEWLSYLGGIEAGGDCLVPSHVWFAREQKSGRLVGVLDIRPDLPADKQKFGHIGYSVVPARRRHGYATQMVRWGVGVLRGEGVGDIFASVYADNAASIRVLEKCGFFQKGLYKEEETGKTIVQYVNIK